MRIIIYFLIVLSFSNCSKRKESVPEKSIKTKVSVKSNAGQTKVPESKTETDYNHIDTLIKKCQPFNINDINCFWELKLFLYKGQKLGTGKLELINQKNLKVILSDDYGDAEDYTLDEFSDWHSFKLMSDDVIKDANFDGYKDFVLYRRSASGSAGEFSEIYLFNQTKKIFERSKVLSGYNISIDTITKTVSSYARNGAKYNVTDTIYFGKNGKIKYQKITEGETIKTKDGTPLFKITYKKVIDGKVVKTKIDTVTNY